MVAPFSSQRATGAPDLDALAMGGICAVITGAVTGAFVAVG